MTDYSFPEKFLWGTATAAHQVEGNNFQSDWWGFEHRKDSHCAEPSLDCCDQYNRFSDDIAIMSSLGLNSYRFSIEWARIEPEEGYYCAQEVDHYKKVLDVLLQHDIIPCVTLHHFSSPKWTLPKGSFTSTEVLSKFLNYVEYLVSSLKRDLPYVCTINEPNIVALMGYRIGLFPPGIAGSKERRLATENFIEAHLRSREIIKSNNASTQVGLALSMTDYQPLPGAEERAARIREIMEDVYLRGVKDHSDFIGVQTYSRDRTPHSGLSKPEEGIPVTEMGYEIYPISLYNTVKRAAAMTGLPVIVTENGIAPVGDDDDIRISFIKDALKGLHQAIEENVDVKGYYYWSFIDNFEWNLGYRPKFGLVACDRKTKKRTIKKSALYYGEIAKKNCLIDD